MKKGQADGAVKSRPSSSQSAGSQKGLDACTPSTSDKISDTEVNGIVKEVSERKPLTNGVTVKADPIGLGKVCVSDAESDSLYKASSSKFQALEDSEILLTGSSSNSVPRKNSEMVPTETPLPIKKELTPRGLINAGNLCFLNATLQALLSCSPFVQLLQRVQFQDIPKVLCIFLYAFSSIFCCSCHFMEQQGVKILLLYSHISYFTLIFTRER